MRLRNLLPRRRRPEPMSPRLTPEAEADLRSRTAHRLAMARRRMGSRYLLHPDNAIQRKSGQENKA